MSITKEWSNAKASCEVPPGEGLVTIWNQDQHDFVASEMRRYEDGKYTQLFEFLKLGSDLEY